jgi:thiol:disulfide interchange protein DsbD
MEKFKIAMGFAMLAAAVWFCSLVSSFYGEHTWDLAIFLVIVALAAWVYGEFVQRGTKRRGLSVVVALLLLGVGYFYELEHQLQWREPIADVKSAKESTASAVTPNGGNWQNWSADAVAKARAEGRPVLVDFTARWCLTCQKDVRPVLESQAVQEKLKSLNAVTLVGDYTRFPPDIFDELARHGRAGVPLVLVYPKDGAQPPIVLPEAVTRGIVLAALDKAEK